MKRNYIGRLAGVAMAVVVALPVVAVAGHQDSGVASYTGCTTGGGGLINLAAGDAPAKPCGANQTEVHLGGGDVTEIEAGSGLTGGATNGKATLAVDPTAVWMLGGNSGTTPGTHFLGTTDTQALEFRVNGARAFRLEPGSVPNVVGGADVNSTEAGVVGATIAGGGCPASICIEPDSNRATADFGTVGGGRGNTASGHSTVAGGFRNSASDLGSTVAGGLDNVASGTGSAVAGGTSNIASGFRSTVAGSFNTAGGTVSAVAGGENNTASGNGSAVAGGLGNIASGTGSAVAGGTSNIASGDRSAVAGGDDNTASGNRSAVAGGDDNIAAGDFSFAAGRDANVDDDHDGTFLWADALIVADFDSAAANEFAARATGGVRFVTAVDPANGAPTMTCGASGGGAVWACTSDRATKTDFARMPGAQVLQRLAGLPITKWRFRGEDASVRHLGPVAQDFQRAFRLGTDSKQIAFSDLAGVALKAAKALYRMVVSHDERIDALERALDRQKRRADRLERRFDRLEKTVADLKA